MSGWFKRIMDSFSNLLPFSVPIDKRMDFLGILYSSPNSSDDPVGAQEVNEAFLEDFRSRVWVTYRRDFVSLIDKDGNPVGITTDAGWGCSVRVTQMLTVQSMISLNFDRDWRISKATSSELVRFKSIIALILDNPTSALSIHSIVKTGHSMFGKRPSEWFGPTTGARAVCSLFDSMNRSARLGVSILCFDSCELIRSEIISKFSDSPSGVIIFLTHKLGLDGFNEERYKSTIQRLFSSPFFQGLSSGEAMVSAYYMYACCDDFLYYLDPHTVQPAFVNVDDFPTLLSPQPKPLKMRWSRLNPSMNMGFAVKDKAELDALCDFLKAVDPDLFEIRDMPRPPPKEYDFPDDVSSDDDDMVVIN